MSKAFWLMLLMTVAGCSQVSPELHPWQSRGDAFSFEVHTTRWTAVESRHLGRVALEHVGEACALLAEAEAIEITPDKARQIYPGAEFDLSGPLKPLLIRGVSYGRPAYSLVRIDKESEWVCVLQATWNGEVLLPGQRYALEPAPIVILLESKPAKVVSVANAGGDAVFRGVDLRKA